MHACAHLHIHAQRQSAHIHKDDNVNALNAPKWESTWGKPHQEGVAPKDQAPGSKSSM